MVSKARRPTLRRVKAPTVLHGNTKLCARATWCVKLGNSPLQHSAVHRIYFFLHPPRCLLRVSFIHGHVFNFLRFF